MQNLIFCWYYIKHALIYTNRHLWTTVFKASIWYAGAGIKGMYPTVVLFLLPHCAFDCIQSNQAWVSLSYDGVKQHASTFCFFLNTRHLGDCTILRLSVFEMWGHFPQQLRSRVRQCSSILVLDYGLKSSKMMAAHVVQQQIGWHGMCPFHPSCDQGYQYCHMWSEWISRARLLGIMQPWLGSSVDKVASVKLLSIWRLL